MLRHKAGVCWTLLELPNSLHRCLSWFTLPRVMCETFHRSTSLWSWLFPWWQFLALLPRKDDPLQSFLSRSWRPQVLADFSLPFCLFCVFLYPIAPRKLLDTEVCWSPLVRCSFLSENGTRMTHSVFPLWSLFVCQGSEGEGQRSDPSEGHQLLEAVVYFRAFRGPMWLVAHWVSFFHDRVFSPQSNQQQWRKSLKIISECGCELPLHPAPVQGWCRPCSWSCPERLRPPGTLNWNEQVGKGLSYLFLFVFLKCVYSSYSL